MTLVQVSQLIGLGCSSLSRIERGEQTPTWETINKLAMFYKHTPGQIVDAIHAKNNFGQIHNKNLPKKVDRLPDGLPKNS